MYKSGNQTAAKKTAIVIKIKQRQAYTSERSFSSYLNKFVYTFIKIKLFAQTSNPFSLVITVKPTWIDLISLQ